MTEIVREYDYVDGNPILASENNKNEITLYNLMNGKLDDENIATGGIGADSIADGSILNIHLASDAAIADTKLAKITTPGKVNVSAISGLSPFVHPDLTGDDTPYHTASSTDIVSTGNTLEVDLNTIGIKANTPTTENPLCLSDGFDKANQSPYCYIPIGASTVGYLIIVKVTLPDYFSYANPPNHLYGNPPTTFEVRYNNGSGDLATHVNIPMLLGTTSDGYIGAEILGNNVAGDGFNFDSGTSRGGVGYISTLTAILKPGNAWSDYYLPGLLLNKGIWIGTSSIAYYASISVIAL